MSYMEEQLNRSIRLLGKHWVLHPDNRVPKLKELLPDVFTWVPKVLKTKRVKK